AGWRFPEARSLRIRRTGARQLPLLERKSMQRIASTAGPPDRVGLRIQCQSEPTLPNSLLIDHLRLREINQAQLMLVVATGRDEGVLVVRERNDVERQIAERYLPASRRNRPAVGQHKTFLGRSYGAGLVFSQHGERKGDEQQGHHGQGVSEHGGVLPVNEGGAN